MSLPQLRMRRWSLEGLDDVQTTPPNPKMGASPSAVQGEGGLVLVRLATPRDVPALVRVLTLAFGEEWSEARVRRELLDHPDVPATFVAVLDGEVVATASYQLLSEFPKAGWVHWVGADPAHAGKGLGRSVVLAVLHAAREDGKTEAGLTTDDPRLPAIRTYLSLGFEPDPWHGSHPERWAAILERMGR